MSIRIGLFGHVCRSNRTLEKALEVKIHGKRPRGRSGQRWADRANDNLNECAQGVSIEHSLDRDRD